MGLAFEVLAGRATNPAAITALTANSGDSFAIRSFPFESPAYIEDMWAKSATAGIVRVRSPRLHDNVQGIRFRTIAATSRSFIGDPFQQLLFPQDVLTFELQGGGAETDNGFLGIYYRNLPGTDARLRLWPDIAGRIVNLLTVEVATTTSATVGDWSGGTAINATFDLLQANVDYAVLGYQSDVAVGAVAIRGPDTGNLRIGGPGTTESLETRDWFVRISDATGTPHIPVINAANKGATLLFVCDPANAAAVNVDLILAQLTPGQ
jgi:hypothetical protein